MTTSCKSALPIHFFVFAITAFLGGSNHAFCQTSHLVIAESHFDEGLDGWTTNLSFFAWLGSEGNPGGYAAFLDSNSTSSYYLAPESFLGDHSELDSIGVLRFDYRVLGTGSFSAADRVHMIIKGPGGCARKNFADSHALVGQRWKQFSVRLKEADWIILDGTWPSILSNVTSLEIVADPFLSTNLPGETTGIDNVSLRVEGTDIAGDVNLDCQVDLLDVLPFVELLSKASFQSEADVNMDGVVDLLDIAPFVDLLNGVQGQTLKIGTSAGQGADVYFRRGDPDQNFDGENLLLKHDQFDSVARKCYLRFDLSDSPKRIENAKIKLTEIDDNAIANANINFFVLDEDSTSGEWNEATITWNNAPANNINSNVATLEEACYVGSLNLDAVSEIGDVYEFESPELTEAVKNRESGLITIVMTLSDNGDSQPRQFASKENAEFDEPQLVLEFR